MHTNSVVISFEEFGDLSKNLRIYQKKDVIMAEGEESDECAYLLSQGSVGVYRTIDGDEVLIDCIDAVNFFGELEVINGGRRMGTVKALSDGLTAYKIHRSDLHSILQKPKIGELLITRLSRDLMNFSNRFVQNEAGIDRLLNEKEAVLQNMKDLLLTIDDVLNSIVRTRNLPIETQESLLALIGMIQKYLALKLPETEYYLENSSAPNYRKMYKENLIPEKLSEILLKTNP